MNILSKRSVTISAKKRGITRMDAILEEMQNNCELDGNDICSLAVWGRIPNDGDTQGIWSWDESKNEVIIGTCSQDFKIVGYEYFDED